MAGIRYGRSMGAFIALSIVFSSTEAIASAEPATVQADPWVALSAMSGVAPAAALCGAAISAAQPAPGCVLPVGGVVPPPPPPPIPAALPVATAGSMWPLIAGLLGAVLVDILILSHHHHYHPTPVPNSPA